MRTTRNRRFASAGLAALLVLTGLAKAQPALALGNSPQSISIDFPSTIRAGGSTVDLTGAASNSTSTDMDAAYEIDLLGINGIEPDQVHVAIESPLGSGNYVPLNLGTAGNSYLIEKTAGFSFPAQTTERVHFALSLDADVPAGNLTVVVSLLKTGTNALRAAWSNAAIGVTSPVTVSGWPTSFVADNKPATFAATVTNNGQVTLDRLRLDVQFPFPNGTNGSHLGLSYESPAGSGSYLPVVLEGTDDLTGEIGDPSGFSLAAGASASINLRLVFAGDFPGFVYHSGTLRVDQVDSAAPHAVLRQLISNHSVFTVSNPAPTLTAPVTIAHYGQLVTVSGTAPAGANLYIYFARRGQTTYVAARNVTATANGRFSTTYAASDDVSYYADNQGTKSNIVTTRVAPMVTGPVSRIVTRATVAVVSGTGSPTTTVTLHFRRPGDLANRYPVARIVTVGVNGHWYYSYTAATDLAYYVSSNTNALSSAIYRSHAR